MSVFSFRGGRVASAAFVAFILLGCGGVVEVGHDAASSGQGGAGSSGVGGAHGSTSNGASGQTSGVGGAGGGNAPGCAGLDGVTVVGCGFRSNLALIDADDATAYVLDAVETDPGTFYETLWRLDRTTHEHVALYSGPALAAPIDRIRSFALKGPMIYGVALEDSAVIKAIPTNASPSTNLVYTGIALGSRLVTDPYSDDGLFFQADGGGVARTDTSGNVSSYTALDGTLIGAVGSNIAVASKGEIHVTDGTTDAVFGSVDDFGAQGASFDGDRVVVPFDAGPGGMHRVDGYYSNGKFTLLSVPDGTNGGPPRFVVPTVFGGEINGLYFMQGAMSGGRLFDSVSGDPAGLFAGTPALGGGHGFRGFVKRRLVAGASTSEGGDAATEGAILAL